MEEEIYQPSRVVKKKIDDIKTYHRLFPILWAMFKTILKHIRKRQLNNSPFGYELSEELKYLWRMHRDLKYARKHFRWKLGKKRGDK